MVELAMFLNEFISPIQISVHASVKDLEIKPQTHAVELVLGGHILFDFRVVSYHMFFIIYTVFTVAGAYILKLFY